MVSKTRIEKLALEAKSVEQNLFRPSFQASLLNARQQERTQTLLAVARRNNQILDLKPMAKYLAVHPAHQLALVGEPNGKLVGGVQRGDNQKSSSSSSSPC